jgi:hypothetical protein
MIQRVLIALMVGLTFLWTGSTALARIPQMEGYVVVDGERHAFPVSPTAQRELEQVLGQVGQLSGMRSHTLPTRYLLFRFPQSAVFMGSPIHHPVREVAVIAPSRLEPPRLLVKNPQNQWVEYQTHRSLLPLLDQLKAHVKQKKGGFLSLMPYYTSCFQI